MTGRGAQEPELSVVLFAPGNPETTAKALRHLGAQSVRDRLEIVIVTPALARLELDASLLDGFHSSSVVETSEGPDPSTREAGTPVYPPGAARAAGIRQARGRIVALAEDHSYAEPGWAEALIRAHQGPWAAVGPAIGNANPESAVSWASLFLAYGQWVRPQKAGVVGDLSEHNTSYKRALLMEYGPRLEALMDRAGGLHRDLQARGCRLYIEPAAKTDHANYSVLSEALQVFFHTGRLFGAVRAREGRWSLWKRLIYVGGAPLLPFMWLRTVLREIRRSGLGPTLMPRILPALLLLAGATGLGEAAGYAWCAGSAAARLAEAECAPRRGFPRLKEQIP
jgi:glycosyl transferase family 2